MGAEPTSIPFFWRDLTHQTLSALQSPGPLPLFSAPSHLCRVGVRVVTPSSIILRCEAVVVQRKDFRVFFFVVVVAACLFCFFKSPETFVCFHLESFDGWCFLLWHSEWKDLWYIDWVEGACGCWVIHPSPCFKLFSLDYLEWSKVVFGWFRPKVDKTKTTMFLKV